MSEKICGSVMNVTFKWKIWWSIILISTHVIVMIRSRMYTYIRTQTYSEVSRAWLYTGKENDMERTSTVEFIKECNPPPNPPSKESGTGSLWWWVILWIFESGRVLTTFMPETVVVLLLPFLPKNAERQVAGAFIRVNWELYSMWNTGKVRFQAYRFIAKWKHFAKNTMQI